VSRRLEWATDDFFFCVGNFKMETWNWELDDRLILTKNFKSLMTSLYYLGSFVCCWKYCMNLETFKDPQVRKVREMSG
jgi:hypothetical protein